MKRVMIISDMHCGSATGLTPTKWQKTQTQTKCWEIYRDMASKHSPVDVLIVNGDAIDGSSHKGIDTLEQDPNAQLDMAAECIDLWKANDIYITAGTDAHTGVDAFATENERHLIDKLKVKAQQDGRECNIKYDICYDLTVDGVVFNLRHYTASKGTMTSRASTASGDAAWDLIKAAVGEKKKARILIRSHVHYFNQFDNGEQFVITTPALQLPGARYAAKKCNGIVHWGCCWFDVENGEYVFDKDLKRLPEMKVPEYVVM